MAIDIDGIMIACKPSTNPFECVKTDCEASGGIELWTSPIPLKSAPKFRMTINGQWQYLHHRAVVQFARLGSYRVLLCSLKLGEDAKVLARRLRRATLTVLQHEPGVESLRLGKFK
ncbi:hypothetical protein PBRA_009352, partial [Plasmodiophora brassicae]